MLKLLKKSEIDEAKAKDRQREINEGIKLANRVDNLRKAQAEEEANLEKFRRETIENINNEIVMLTKEKNMLSKEVSELEDARRIALEPLDKEWDEVRLKQDELTQYAIDLNNEKSQLEQSKKEMEIENELLNVEKKRISRERDDSITALARAEENLQKTNISLKNATNVQESVKEMKKNVTKELKERDAICASKERDLENKEKLLNKDRKELEKLRVKLLDQRATLERAMAMINKSGKI